MPGDKRRLRGLNEVQCATKRVLRSSSISKVESVNSTETGECAGSKPTKDTSSCDGDTVQRTAGSFTALSDGKTKISDNLAAVNAGKTDERHLSEDLIAQAASNFKPTVVSLASFEGDTMLVECTGVCIECPDPNNAKFLTSLSLCTSSDGKRMVSDNFRIEVSFPNEVLNGQVVYYDSYYGIAVVSTQHVPVCEGVRRLVLDHDEALKSSSEVVALWCSSSSDKLMAESGQLIGPLDGTVHKLMFSTCKITTAGVGGPLIDIDGNFVGMNYYSQMGDHSQKVVTPCLPRNLILKCMEHSGIVRLETKQEGDGTIGSSTDTREICKSSTHGNFYLEGLFTMNPDHEKYVKQTAKSYGYPLPDLLHANMYMVNTFEENFVKDTWTKLGKDVASKMSESVVPLASFNGNARFFACTGVFIGKSKSFQTILTSASLVRISGNDSMRHNNLQIEVRLLNKRRARGKLTYCNFDYNIALVNIDETIPPRTIELQQPPVTTGTPVRAVGCLFDKCRLMATNGKVTEKSGTSDCNEHRISTCNITKAGIGGPLIDTCGNFVGMNFYGNKETPFVPASVLLKVLGEFIGQWPEDALPIIGNADEKGGKCPSHRG